jgi:lipopolysaccharide export system ATP-binding protein
MPIHQRARLGLSYLPQEASIFQLAVEQTVRAVAAGLLQIDAASKDQATLQHQMRLDALLQDLRVDRLRLTRHVGADWVSADGWKSPRWPPALHLILLDEPFAGIGNRCDRISASCLDS